MSITEVLTLTITKEKKKGEKCFGGKGISGKVPDMIKIKTCVADEGSHILNKLTDQEFNPTSKIIDNL
jgi:hypothetical protein